jgi:hypothetical protein
MTRKNHLKRQLIKLATDNLLWTFQIGLKSSAFQHKFFLRNKNEQKNEQNRSQIDYLPLN